MALAGPERVTSLTIMCSRATPFPAFTDLAAALRRGEAYLALLDALCERVADTPLAQAGRA